MDLLREGEVIWFSGSVVLIDKLLYDLCLKLINIKYEAKAI
jgi:hypothetical protein